MGTSLATPSALWRIASQLVRTKRLTVFGHVTPRCQFFRLASRLPEQPSRKMRRLRKSQIKGHATFNLGFVRNFAPRQHGAFFLYVSILSIIAVVVVLMALMLMFLLGVQAARRADSSPIIPSGRKLRRRPALIRRFLATPSASVRDQSVHTLNKFVDEPKPAAGFVCPEHQEIRPYVARRSKVGSLRP
jgi:hypothetical protein